MNIQEYFKDKKITILQIKNFLSLNPTEKQKLYQSYKKYSDLYRFEYFIKFMLLNLLQKKCLTCQKLLTQHQINIGKKYCSYKCSMNYQEIKRRNLQKFGVQFLTKSDEIKSKIKQNVKKKYGVQNVSQLQSVKKKVKQTNLRKYDNECPLRNTEIAKKTKETNLKKYGTEYGFQSNVVKQKIKKTMIEKYGVQHSLCNKQIKQKFINTSQKKYGTNNPFQSDIVKQKIKQTCLKKYGSDSYHKSDQYKRKRFQHYINLFKNYVIPLFDIKDFNIMTDQTTYKWKCVKCGHQFYSYYHQTNIDGKNVYIPRCLKCYPYLNNGVSVKQKELLQFIKSIYNDTILNSDKNIIHPKQLDIYLPQKKLAIQFDGLYWHSDIKLNNDYHLIKTQLCLQKEIQLIHIFEDQWLYKQQIVKDRIKSLLGIDRKRIYARKCQIKEISTKDKNIFLNQNHLQGQDNSKVKLGLYFQNCLISVMTFGKPRFNNNYEWQMIRFASKLGCQVIGGASKLLSYFQNNYHPKNLISYADRRYSNGKMYYSLGFTFLNNSQPNYWWYKQNVKYSRYQCQKHRLKNILGQNNFDEKLSESQNMYVNGFNKIYDCGNIVFEKSY